MTVGDDKAYAEFRFELTDSTPDTWKRAILLEVIGKFKSVADYKKLKAYPNCTTLLSNSSLYA